MTKYEPDRWSDDPVIAVWAEAEPFQGPPSEAVDIRVGDTESIEDLTPEEREVRRNERQPTPEEAWAAEKARMRAVELALAAGRLRVAQLIALLSAMPPDLMVRFPCCGCFASDNGYIHGAEVSHDVCELTD